MRPQTEEPRKAHGGCQSHRAIHGRQDLRRPAAVGLQVSVQDVSRRRNRQTAILGELNVKAKREREQKQQRDERF